MLDPDRFLCLLYAIDTNRANAYERLGNMNQLEEWGKVGVIELIMSDTVRHEITQAGSAAHSDRVDGAIYTRGGHLTLEEIKTRAAIETVLFPEGAKTSSELNDVDIVFQAGKYGRTLVTADGASRRQPGGILGKRDELRRMTGVRILTDQEAVDEVRSKILSRDDLARESCRRSGKPLPKWVGND